MATEDLKVFNDLYSDNDAVVFQALTIKKDWMFENLLYAKGDIDIKLDSKGRIHYPAIESLLDDTLLFDDLIIDPNHLPNEDLRREIEVNLNDSFQFLNLYEEIDESAPFWIEYDFNLIDDNGFNCLFPNFFRKHDIETWQISPDEKAVLKNDIEQLKYSLIGNEGEHVIIMDKCNLLNGVFFAPIAKRIIYKSTIDDELKEELNSIAKEKNIGIEEITL